MKVPLPRANGMPARNALRCLFDLAYHRLPQQIYNTSSHRRYLSSGNCPFKERVPKKSKLCVFVNLVRFSPSLPSAPPRSARFRSPFAMLQRHAVSLVLAALLLPLSTLAQDKIFFTNADYSNISIGVPFDLTWAAGDGTVSLLCALHSLSSSFSTPLSASCPSILSSIWKTSGRKS